MEYNSLTKSLSFLNFLLSFLFITAYHLLLCNNYIKFLCEENLLFFTVSKCKICTLEEQAIINIIKSNPMIKQEEIANMINRSLKTVKTRMNEMQEKGLIARKNGKRNSEWIIL
jgi:DNA-binding MarR family transcriptional regulator